MASESGRAPASPLFLRPDFASPLVLAEPLSSTEAMEQDPCQRIRAHRDALLEGYITKEELAKAFGVCISTIDR